MAFHSYLLANPGKRIQIGQTDDLDRRLSQHNDPACRLGVYTKRFCGPWTLVYSESFVTRDETIARVQYVPYSRTRSMTRRYWSKLTLSGTEWSLW